jgi:hypothetical protein
VRPWHTVVGVPHPRAPRTEWRVERVDTHDLPDGVPLWRSEEDATLAACHLHDHRTAAKGVPAAHLHTHVSRKGRAVPAIPQRIFEKSGSDTE